jgi:hypothetical protein
MQPTNIQIAMSANSGVVEECTGHTHVVSGLSPLCLSPWENYVSVLTSEKWDYKLLLKGFP